MKALFYTREYPPYVYGGAGVHVEYLAKELAELMEVDVRCFGDQNSETNQLYVTGFPSAKNSSNMAAPMGATAAMADRFGPRRSRG